MAVTRGTLQVARRLRRDIGAEVDSAVRTLTAEWVDAWDGLATAWQAAADDLVGIATRAGRRWPPPVQIIRSGRVDAAMRASIAALGKLAERTETVAADAADRVVQLDTEYEARIIASQAPQVEAPALAQRVASLAPVESLREAWALREQARDDVQLLVLSRIRTDATGIMAARAREQIHAGTLPLSDAAVDTMRRELVRGVDVGDNPRSAAARMVTNVQGQFNGGLTRALTIARTETLDAYRATSHQIHNANADVVPAWQWHAELDIRCCPSCWAMDGQQFPSATPGPDDHPQGRCARLPVLASWESLGITAPEPPSAWIDAEERFWALPLANRLRIMGPGRLQLLQDGRVGFRDLSTLRHNPRWRTSRAPTPLRDLQRGASRRPAGPAPAPVQLSPAASPQPTAGQLFDTNDNELVASARRIYEGTFAGIRTRVTAAKQLNSVTVQVRGELRDASGSKVGAFSRVVMRADDGATVAYHDALEIAPRIQGQGFAQAFNGHLERWYRTSGVDRIELYANIDVGGYAWARAGYSFAHHRAAERVLHRLRTRVDFGQLDDQGTLIPAADLAAARQLLDRAERLPFGSAGYPMAYEVSQLGRWPGAGRDDMWLGKRTLLGANWDAVKPL